MNAKPNITEVAQATVENYKNNFADEMSFEVFIEMEYDTCAPFTDEVDSVGGLRKLEEACRSIDPSLF